MGPFFRPLFPFGLRKIAQTVSVSRSWWIFDKLLINGNTEIAITVQTGAAPLVDDVLPHQPIRNSRCKHLLACRGMCWG
jgi:hypothetical protein